MGPRDPERSHDDDLQVELSWGDAGARDEVPPVTAEPEAAESAEPATTAGDDVIERLIGIQQTLDSLRTEVAELRQLRAEPARGRPATLAAAPQDLVLAELAAMRAELVALKRRVTLRVDAPVDRTVTDADLVARLVAERLAPVSDAPPER